MAALKTVKTDSHLRENEQTSFVQLEEVERVLSSIWTALQDRSPQRIDNTFSLPYQTLRYVDEVERAFEQSYLSYPGSAKLRDTLKQIEIDCHAIEAGINARELPTVNNEYVQSKAIFVALRILIKEFKEDRMKDSETRLALFAKHLSKLALELHDVFGISSLQK